MRLIALLAVFCARGARLPLPHNQVIREPVTLPCEAGHALRG